jgi:3-oxoacyl-[acyl-carrier protein] reductase
MDLRLKGKRALITGGTRGIGKAIAETFASEGCNTVICARNSAEVEKVVESLKSRGVSAWGAAVDVTDEKAVKDWVSLAADQMGGLDIIVSNVGAMALSAEKEAWEKNLKMDIFGLVNLVEAGMEHLEKAAAENGDAAITAIGSTAATAAANPSAYGAIKGAITHYIKGVAKVNAAKKVRANVVAPGMVYFEDGVWSRIEQNQPDVFKASLARNPTGRMATPQEIANAVVFISSPCSTFTSGINMIVDGAMTDRVNY